MIYYVGVFSSVFFSVLANCDMLSLYFSVLLYLFVGLPFLAPWLPRHLYNLRDFEAFWIEIVLALLFRPFLADVISALTNENSVF